MVRRKATEPKSKPNPPSSSNVVENGKNHISVKLAIPLILFSFLIFCNTINQYFLLDDFEHLDSIRYNRLSHVLQGFDSNLENKFLRPIPMFSYWVQSKLFGPSPIVFHITTVLLHALAAIMAANLFYLLFGNPRCAAILGFVFIAFPNHAEVVNWPAINFTSWAAIFYLATLNLFGYYRLYSRIPFFLASLATFLAATMSKETAFTLPASLVVFDYFFSISRGVKRPFGKRVIDHCMYLGLFVLVLAIFRKVLSTGVGYRTPEGDDLVLLYLGNIYVLFSDLIRMNLRAWKYLIAPVSPEIPYARYIIILIWLALIIAYAVLIRKRRINLTALVFCFLFASIAWLPVLGTFRVLEMTHWIRFLYLPSVASCYIVSMALDGMSAGLQRAWMRNAILAAAFIPMVCLTKFYDNEWIKGQQENKEVIHTIVEEFDDFPQYSRVYVSNTPWARKEVPRIGYAFPGAIGIYCDRERIEAALNFLPANKLVPLDRERYSEHDWRYFWLDWNRDTKTLDVAGSIQPETDTGVPSNSWDFSNRWSQGQLAPSRDIIQGIRPRSPYPVFVVDGPWAFLWLPGPEQGRPVKYLTLDMMLRNKKGRKDITRIFWIAKGDPDVSGGKSIGFLAHTDGEFHEYRIPLYRNGLSLIHPRIIRFAIRPSQNSGTFFSIRKMTVEYY